MTSRESRAREEAKSRVRAGAQHRALYFLRQVTRGLWDGAVFHRSADHVLQASNQGPRARQGATSTSAPYQEYSPSLPHSPYTVGLAGSPGGPDWYISTLDNTQNHGPGSQSADAALFGEADPCFGKLIEGRDVIAATKALPTAPGGFGLLQQPVTIMRATEV